MITTAGSDVKADFRGNRLLQSLMAIYALIWVVTAIAPFNRFDWFLENLLVFAFGTLLIASYRRVPLSDLSYVFITLFLILHSIGAHYTYSETPVGFWMQAAFGWERNHYDRIVHFGFGLLMTYPLRDALGRILSLGGIARDLFTLTAIMAMSETYEIAEWIAASVLAPEAAHAFLGTQGDVFDAQKDSALAALGAALLLTGLRLAGLKFACRHGDRGRI